MREMRSYRRADGENDDEKTNVTKRHDIRAAVGLGSRTRLRRRCHYCPIRRCTRANLQQYAIYFDAHIVVVLVRQKQKARYETR